MAALASEKGREGAAPLRLASKYATSYSTQRKFLMRKFIRWVGWGGLGRGLRVEGLSWQVEHTEHMGTRLGWGGGGVGGGATRCPVHLGHSCTAPKRAAVRSG